MANINRISEIAPDHITLEGDRIPAEWSISYTGRTVNALLDMGGGRCRVPFTGECGELFTAAMAAAKRGDTTQVDGEGLGLVLATGHAIPTRTAEPKPVNPDKQRHGEVPEKWFIGQEMTGKGWRILFDGTAGKTRVIFKKKPAAAVLEAVKAAGFCWSPRMMSWNKGLNFRAYRAAEQLRDQLHALTA